LDKRAHTRIPIHLGARVHLGTHAPCPCTVRDFCEGGLFLALAPEDAARLFPADRPLPRDERLTVELDLIGEGASRPYRVSGTVARVIGQGVGVSFVRPDPQVLAALRRHARATRDSRSVSGRREAPGVSQEARRAALSGLREAVSSALAGLLAPFFRDIDQDLVAAASRSTSFISQGRFFDAKGVLRSSSEDIRGAFARGVLADIDAMIEEAGSGGAGGGLQATGELSLIDPTDFEDMLATSEIATRVEERLAGPLGELQRRLAALSGLPTDVSACPVGPSVFAEAFRSGVAGLGIDRQALHVVYRAFERGLLPGLTDLYARANALLARQGVEPAAPAPHVIVRHPVSEPRRPRETDVLADLARFLERERLPQPGTGSAPAPAGGGDPRPARAAPSPEPDPEPSVALGVAPPAQDQRAAPGGERVARGVQSLLELARWSRTLGEPGRARRGAGALPEGPQGDDAAGSQAAEPEPDEVINALSALQAEGLDLAEAAGEDGVRGRVLERLARERPGSPGLRLAPDQEAAFDLVAGLLRSVLEDVLLYGASKRRVGRLAAPLHKLALLDEGFLQDPAHPARRLVNRIGELDPESDSPDGEGPVWARVDPLLERVARGFDRDVGVFADAARALDSIVEEQRARYRARVEQVVRVSEGQQAVLRARRGAGESARPLTPELAEWVTRARRLRVGDRLELGVGTARAERVELVWVGEDQGAFVFVNRRGEKVATLSLQEVAMQLRRGTARALLEPGDPLVDRALDGVMERVHRGLEDQARRDPSTGVLSPLAFEHALEAASRDAALRQVPCTLCYLDLDRFRVLLDVQGPAAGAAYLGAVGPAIAAAVPTSATVGRLASDIFAVLLPQTGVEAAEAVAESCRVAVQALRVDWEGAKLSLTVSIGVVGLGNDGLHARDLLQAAQSACQAAKDAGQDRVRVFELGDQGLRRRQEVRAALARVSQSIQQGRATLRCQPIVPLGADEARLPYLEVLLGLKDPAGNLIPAAELVAAAEQYEQAAALDRLVIRETLRWMSERGPELERLGGCAVNLSPRSLADEGLAAYVMDELMQSRVPPGKLVFEVTETAAVTGLSNAQQFMRSLSDLGCRFSLDDFGAGHASFAYLKGLPVDFVKIDGLFVHDLGQSPQDLAVVKSINEVAHAMGKQTIAEHVHSPEVVEQLKAIGVDYAQGYWLGEPRALEVYSVFDQTVPLAGVAAAVPAPEEVTLRLSN